MNKVIKNYTTKKYFYELEKFDKIPLLFKDNSQYKLLGLNNYLITEINITNKVVIIIKQ
jgi:hypothetical protein